MEKSEIVAGLRSALNRGYPLDFAKKSFINSGYDSQDIEDSAAVLISGGESQVSQKPVLTPQVSTVPTVSNVKISDDLSRSSQPVSQPIISQTPIQPAYKPLPRMPIQNQSYNRSTDEYGVPKSHGLGLVIVLSIIFLFVLGVLGMLIFKRELVESLLKSWGLI